MLMLSEALVRPEQGLVLRLAALPLGLMRREARSEMRLERQPLLVGVQELPAGLLELERQPPGVAREP